MDKLVDLNKLNINTTFKVARESFLHLIKIIYIDIKLKKALISKTRVMRSTISFLERNQYLILRLKQSKTDNK